MVWASSANYDRHLMTSSDAGHRRGGGGREGDEVKTLGDLVCIDDLHDLAGNRAVEKRPHDSARDLGATVGEVQDTIDRDFITFMRCTSRKLSSSEPTGSVKPEFGNRVAVRAMEAAARSRRRGFPSPSRRRHPRSGWTSR